MVTLLLMFLLTAATIVGLVVTLLAATGSVLALPLGVLVILPVFWMYGVLLGPLAEYEERFWERFDSPPVKAAKAAFRASHPEQRVSWTGCIPEESRYVVSVFHGSRRPRESTFYAVDRATLTASLLEDDKAYRPTGLR